LATKFATVFDGRANFTNPSGIPQFRLQTMTVTGVHSLSECLGLTDNWSSPRAANQEGLVSKRRSDPPGDPKTANEVFGFPWIAHFRPEAGTKKREVLLPVVGKGKL
jgi:hypothetical protein